MAATLLSYDQDFVIEPWGSGGGGTTPGTAPRAPTNPVTDDGADTFTYNPSGSSTPTAPKNPVTDDGANTLTYTPATY